jgi:hypothetical protein
MALSPRAAGRASGVAPAAERRPRIDAAPPPPSPHRQI